MSPAAGKGKAAQLQVIPAETWAASGESRKFTVAAFDANGDPVAAPSVTWSLDGLPGEIGADGSYKAVGDKPSAGTVKAAVAAAGEGLAIAKA